MAWVSDTYVSAVKGTDADTVFNLLPGSTLRNVVIGKHQSEGVHALGDAWVENVWWEDVCEDALTSKGLNTQLRVIGGGARNATDKVNTTSTPPPQSLSIRGGVLLICRRRSSKTTPLAGSSTLPDSTPTLSVRLRSLLLLLLLS